MEFGVRRFRRSPPPRGMGTARRPRPAFPRHAPKGRASRNVATPTNLTDGAGRGGSGALDTPLPPEAQLSSLRSECVLQVRKLRLYAGKSCKVSSCNPPPAACERARAQPCGRSSSGPRAAAGEKRTFSPRNGGSARGLFPGGRGRRSAAPRPSRGHVSARVAGPGRAAVAASSAPGEGHGKLPGRVPPGRARRRLGAKAGSGGGQAAGPAAPRGPTASPPGAATPIARPAPHGW